MDGGDAAGGSAELARLIDECGESILSDLSTYHGIKPWEILDGPYSPKLLIAYIRNMPLGSATSAALQGGDGYRGWDNQTYLLAAIVDAVRENTYAFVSANSKRKPKAPEPIQRPSARGAKKRTNRFAAMARQAYTKNANRKDADGSGSGR